MPAKQYTGSRAGSRNASIRSNYIPDSAFSAAKEGGIGFALVDLFQRIDNTNFRIEFLDVLFHHLQPKWMDPPTLPSCSSPVEYFLADQLRVARARNAAMCATKGMGVAVSCAPEHLRSLVAERILDHLDDYIGWLRYLLSDSVPQDPEDELPLADPSAQCSTLLYMLQHERLGPTIMNSNQVVDYVIAAWSAINPRTAQAYLNFALDKECPILDLFSQFLSRTETRQMINDALNYNSGASRKLRSAVIKAAISRCVQVAELDKEALDEKFATEYDQDPDMELVVWSSVEATFNTLSSIFHTVAQLCEHPGMAAVVMKSTFLERFAQALDIWLTKKTSREEHENERMVGFRLMHAAHGLVEEQARQFGGAYWRLSRTAFTHLLCGGSLSVLCEGLSSVRVCDEERNWLYIRDCLVHLQNQCYVYPTLCKPARLELAKILGVDFWRTQAFEPTGWTKYWNSAALTVVASCLTPFQKSITFLCDSLYCCSVRPLPVPARTCSGCHSAVYCSKACQEVDWKSLHRAECTSSAHASEDNVWTRNPIHFRRRELLRQHIAQVIAAKAYLELGESDALKEAGEGPCILSMDTDSPSCVSSIDEYLVFKDPGREASLTAAYTQRRVEDGQRLLLVNASSAIAGYVMEVLVMARAKEEHIDVEARLNDDSPEADPICTVLCHTTTFMDLANDDSDDDS